MFEHKHEGNTHGAHGNVHGAVNADIASTEQGIRAIKWSFFGLFITAAIMKIVYDSGKMVFTRLVDGVDPHVIDEIRHEVGHHDQVREVTEVRARWLGHRLVAELNIAVDSGLDVGKAHDIVVQVRDELMGHLRYLSNVVIHVDPENASGEKFHARGT